MTNREIRAFLTSVDPGRLRVRAGITLATIAAALGTDRQKIHGWENGHRLAHGPAGAAYARFIAGLARHEEVSA